MSTSPKKSITIKNMVCPRCIETVRRLAESLGIQPLSVALGEITLEKAPSKNQMQSFSRKLETSGFEIVESRKAQEVTRIKTLIINRVHYPQGHSELNLSTYLAQSLNSDYSRISKLFSSMEGISIERYTTLQRIEKAKELLIYGQLNISEIAEQLEYSSPAHLSAQFKRETGLSPSQFKNLRHPGRKGIDSV